VASAVGEIAEQVPSARLDRVAGALEELATVAPHAAANVANDVIRGQARLDSLRNVAARLGISVGESDTVNAITSDLTLVDPHGKKLWVIFSTTGVRGWQIGSARGIIEEIKQADTAYVGVLLLGARRQGSSESWSTTSGTVWVVEMGEDIDEHELERIITAAFATGHRLVTSASRYGAPCDHLAPPLGLPRPCPLLLHLLRETAIIGSITGSTASSLASPTRADRTSRMLPSPRSRRYAGREPQGRCPIWGEHRALLPVHSFPRRRVDEAFRVVLEPDGPHRSAKLHPEPRIGCS
jgi:hypothetical protein